MTLRFGTDGVRGVANADLTPELVLALGRAAARVLGGQRFLVGRDTRASGPLLQAALSAGIASEGVDVVDVGVLSTPGVAYLSAADNAAAAMISASHNPFPDNGIKLFTAGGRKLPDEVEARLETELDALVTAGSTDDQARPIGADLGRLTSAVSEGRARYQDSLVAALEGRRLDGMRVVLDCAHGAASAIAPAVLARLGVTVTILHDQPDGTNINDHCGSTSTASLQKAVLDVGAEVGLAFDGDADRVLAVDHRGELVDGDRLIALCALDLRNRRRLVDNTVVVTVMTNLGFHLAMNAEGIKVVQTKVGDRYVLEALEAGGWSLGGEQSGHIIFSELATTGDGLLTGLCVLDAIRRSGSPLTERAAEVMTSWPQVLRNVRMESNRLTGAPLDAVVKSAEHLWAEVAAVESELGDRGRVLIRPSGTEPLVRVMVEASNQATAEAAATRLCAAVERSLGSSSDSD